MTTTQLVWGRAGSETFGTPVPVFNSPGAVSERITPSLVNRVSTTSASASAQRSFCRVTTDTAIYVKFGPASGLNAANDTGIARFMVPANWSELFEVASGDFAAVVLVP